MACARTVGADGQPRLELFEFRTFTDGLVALRDWLAARKVTVVAMESTGVFWKPLWRVLEPVPDWQLMLVNPQHFRRVPGRKTDVKDAQWLAELAAHGLMQPSFVPPADIRLLRDMTRYRTQLTHERGREAQRLTKVLEDAGIKIQAVLSDIQGVSARRMMEALIGGERDPLVIAELALGRARTRSTMGQLRRGAEGGFTDRHAGLLTAHLNHIDQLTGSINALDSQVAWHTSGYQRQIGHLITIPGVGRTTAEIIIAEVGPDISQFPDRNQLAAWAGLSPGSHQSAGKHKKTPARRGNKWLRSALFEAARAASRGRDTRLAARHQRLHRRFGKNNERKATFALAHTIVLAVWRVLQDNRDYIDLGPDYYTRRDGDKHRNYLISQLQQLGYKITLEASRLAPTPATTPRTDTPPAGVRYRAPG